MLNSEYLGYLTYQLYMSKKTIHYWMNAEIVTNSIAWWYFCIQFHHIWYNWIELRLWTVQWTPTRLSVMDFLSTGGPCICYSMLVSGSFWSISSGSDTTRLKIYRYLLIHFLEINSSTYTNILCKPAVQILQKYIGMYLFLIECIYLEVSY